MTDKERYKRTFSLLHASDRSFMEVNSMKTTKVMPIRRFVSICAAAILVVAMATVAYANDVGGIQTAVRRSVEIWVGGEQKTADLEIGNGRYSGTYEDENGEQKTIFGGGVAYDADGNERPLTEQEIVDYLNRPNYPDVSYYEDGTVWISYRDQKIEITDQFEDGVCYVHFGEGDDEIYVTVRKNGGYSTSPNGYPKP